MSTRKNDSRTQIIKALIGLAGIIIGTFGTIFIRYLQPQDRSIAKVQQYEGVYVFIRSRPNTDYVSLGSVETNSLTRTVESTQGKKRFGNIAKSIGQSLITELPFENRLKEIVAIAKQRQPQLQGLIFTDDLTRCEEIKFK